MSNDIKNTQGVTLFTVRAKPDPDHQGILEEALPKNPDNPGSDPCSNNSTSAPESAPDSLTPESRSLDLAWLDCANETNGVKPSLDSDIPTAISQETLTPSITTDTKDKSTSSPPLRPVNPSPSGENGWEQQTKETVSQHSQERSLFSNPDTSALRTSQDCSTAPTDPDTSTSIFHIYSDNLPSSGTMRNGYVSAQDTLALPSLDDGYCWLESPTALSATPGRRPPGLSRLENQLKEYGLIEKGQVLRPDFLLSSYNLPKTYLDPSEKRTAIQLYEDSGRQLEIFSTPELQPSPSDESSICPGCRDVVCDISTGCGVCGWSTSSQPVLGETENPLEPKPDPVLGETENPLELKSDPVLGETENPLELKSDPVLGETENPLELKSRSVLGETENPLELKSSRASGWLEHYTKNKKLKQGIIATYPRVQGERDPDNPEHWYWAYRWEEKRGNAKSDNGYVTRAISLPRHKVQAVSLAIARHWSVKKILSFIKGEMNE